MRILALIFVVSLTAFASSVRAENYKFLELYELAREKDPSLGFFRSQLDGARAQRDVSRGQMFPQLSVFGDWSENKVRYENTELGQIPTQEYPGERYGLQLKAPLFSMRAWREYERRSALVGQSQEELVFAETELLGSLVKAYLEVLLADETSLALDAELVALQAEVTQAEALFDRSLIPVTAVLEAKTRLDALSADVIEASGQAQIAREALVQIVGIRNIEPSAVASKILLSTPISSPDSAAELALKFDSNVASKEEAVLAARKGIAREKGSWLPEVDFLYTSQYSDVGFDNLVSPPRSSESYSISFRYPIFEGGSGSARLRGAWAEFYAAQHKLEEARRSAVGRARAAWLGLDAATERVSATQVALKTAEINLEAASKAVKLGSARVSDVLLALAQRTRAKRTLNKARFERAMAWLELELAIGSDPGALAPQFSTALHGP